MSETHHGFCLRLNNHPGFITGALAELYASQTMVDVTLAAEGHSICAHRLVLAACSPYFKNILTQNDDSSHFPIVIIKDMPFVDLKAIIDFIYRGEICIPRQQLPSILSNGAQLQIKGLHEFAIENKFNDMFSDTCADNTDNTDSESIEEGMPFNAIGKACLNGLYGMNALNGCEVNEMKTNKKGTQTTTTRKTSNGSTNGEKCLNYGQNMFANNACVDTSANDQMSRTDSTKGDDKSHSNKDFIISEKFTKNVSLNECELNRDNERSIASLMSNKISDKGYKGYNSHHNHSSQNSMTANRAIGTDSIVPFKLMEQSMMIDVKRDVDSDANQRSNQCTTKTTGAFNEADIDTGAVGLYLNKSSVDRKECHLKEENSLQNELTFETNDEFNTENAFDERQTMAKINKKCLMPSKVVEKKAPTTRMAAKQIQRQSKAGIPKKGTSLRSQKQFKCPVCHKVYVSPQNMREHLRNTHTNPDQKYVCSVCQRQYSWKHALDRHFKSKHTAN